MDLPSFGGNDEITKGLFLFVAVVVVVVKVGAAILSESPNNLKL